MKKNLFLLVVIAFSVSAVSFAAEQSISANGLTFQTDEEKPKLESNEVAVFPYSDEGTILLKMASKIKECRGKEFSLIIDPFCGDGKSGLPLVFHHIAERLHGSDINPRAVKYAKKNAQLNHLETQCCFSVRNIMQDGLESSDAPGNTLWIANPPFALKAKGADLEVMRDGGENGLTLTLAFATQALTCAKPGDVILGIGYSRIRTDGSIELEQELTKLTQKHGGNLQLVLLEGEKLWRGFNGKKEQNNPMIISKETFALKANPANPDEISAYQNAAAFHNEAGFDRLGYYAYIINK